MITNRSELVRSLIEITLKYSVGEEMEKAFERELNKLHIFCFGCGKRADDNVSAFCLTCVRKNVATTSTMYDRDSK